MNEVIKLATVLMTVILELLKAGDDDEAQEEALMKGHEAIKRELDRRKFGKKS